MVKGCDVSHWQGTVNFSDLKSKGIEFVYAKATDGTGGVDHTFARNRFAAKEAGLIFGSYHYFHPTLDVDLQVRKFLSVASHQVGELPPALDWEATDKGTMGRALQKAKALQFVKEIEAQTGIAPMIYASPGFLEQYGDLQAFAHYPLWIAHYGVTHPRVPAPWSYYTMWQYTDSHGLDLDVFNGSIDHLKAMSIAA